MGKRRICEVISLAFLFFAILLVLNICIFKSAARVKIDQSTIINHTPVEFFIPGKRILLHANLADPAGIAAARVYFGTSKKVKDLVFYLMKPQVVNYAGIIPAPALETEKIYYRFLAVDCNGYVAKSDFFELQVNKEVDFVPAWQGDFEEYGETLTFGKEYTKFGKRYPSTVLEGFEDNVIVKKAKREERYFLATRVKKVPKLRSYECWRYEPEAEEAETKVAEVGKGGFVDRFGRLSPKQKVAIVGGGVLGAGAIGGGIAIAVNDGGGDDGGTVTTTTTTTSTTSTTTPNIPILPKQTFSSQAEGGGGGSVTFTPEAGEVGTPVNATICFDTLINLGPGWHIRVNIEGKRKDFDICNTSGQCGINCDLGKIFNFSSIPQTVKFFVNVKEKGRTKFFEGSLPLEFNE